jgi:GTPase
MGKLLLKDVYNIKKLGVVISGQVIEGTLLKGDILYAGSQKIKIDALEANHVNVDKVEQGNTVGSVLKGLSYDELLKYKKLELQFGESQYASDKKSPDISKKVEHKKSKGFFSRLFNL